MSHPLLLLLLLNLLNLLNLLPVQSLDAGDAAALFAVKKSLNSPSLESAWNTSADPCQSWVGITCSNQRVVSINLTGIQQLSCSSGSSSSRHSWDNFQTQQRQQQQPTLLADSTCFRDGSCILQGSLSPEIGNLSNLRSLLLGFNSLTGEIPREIGKLRSLRTLELQQNVFTGSIPDELGDLVCLQVLNLEGNSLEGTIPLTLAKCRALQKLRLGGNKLRGGIPSNFGALTNLRHLSLPSNELNNPVPASLHGSCGALEYLDLGLNFFIREIPAWLGNCSRLQYLVLKSNYFVGTLPLELGRLSMLRVLDVSMNRLTGQVPSTLGSCLELSVLVLTNPGGSGACGPVYRWGNAVKEEFNEFSGALPGSIASLPKLKMLWAPQAELNGELPDGWGACRSLVSLNLARNNLTGVFPAGLGRCRSLKYLDVSSNRLKGSLPYLPENFDAAAELPTSCMVVFNVSRNGLSGMVPAGKNSDCVAGVVDEEDLVNAYLVSGSSYCKKVADGSCWRSAVVHDLSMNNFTGPVPEPFIGEALMGGDQASYSFLLADNQLSGEIPPSFFALCARLKAFVVDLSNNRIEGELSDQEFGACESLLRFNASHNQIGQDLPKDLGNLKNLTLLDLSHNRLTGGVPVKLGELQMLKYLVLANNSLTGEIPEELSRASSLGFLDLSSNTLSGSIPTGFGNLSHLEVLILNNNLISGAIPEALIRIPSLVSVNFAYNNLSGAIPDTGSWAGLCDDNKNFRGNPYLQPCTTLAAPLSSMAETLQPVAAPDGSSSKGGLSIVVIVAITSGCAVALVLIVLALLVQCTKQRIPRPPANQGGRKEVVTFTSISFRFTYENVVRATGNFSVDYLIGNGGFGATYKAEMMPGLVVAVKRLHIGRFQGVQQFDTEIRTLGRIRHPNLVTLIGYHASEAEMFLIYNYFPRGNLESFIHNRSRGEITWQVVHKIALGIAEALAYLHDECVPRVLHRDIKPSNILLDNNLTAFLADFGLARLLGASETHATTDVAGTFGYVAPEYAMTCRVSEKADVYSYGVVLLELLSGKKALDAAFSDYGHGFNIVGWACLLIGQGRAHEVFIVELWEMGPENCLLETLKLAVMCTVDSLTVRPTMRQVVDRLRHIEA